jgi:transaldolase
MTMTIRIAVAISVALLAGCDVPTCPNGSIDDCKSKQAMQRKLDNPMFGVNAYHDDLRSVTCWITLDSRGGLSCLPDWMLTKPELKP